MALLTNILFCATNLHCFFTIQKTLTEFMFGTQRKCIGLSMYTVEKASPPHTFPLSLFVLCCHFNYPMIIFIGIHCIQYH